MHHSVYADYASMTAQTCMAWYSWFLVPVFKTHAIVCCRVLVLVPFLFQTVFSISAMGKPVCHARCRPRCTHL